jgi:hypothetical protein
MNSDELPIQPIIEIKLRPVRPLVNCPNVVQTQRSRQSAPLSSLQLVTI